MEARQRQDMSALKAELKADNRALVERLDRLIEILLTSRHRLMYWPADTHYSLRKTAVKKLRVFR